jgi:hypothetical protein
MKMPATTPAPTKAVGWPTKGDRAMTGAERQAALRRRQREAAMTAHGHPQGQPTPVILAALARQLDDPQKANMHATLRDLAR